MTTIYDLPQPGSDDLERSKALSHCIRQEMDHHQSMISFSTYMNLALYHPEWGYYNAKTFDLGKQGDFTTAPEISPLFAQCFARQIQDVFSHLGTRDLLEAGAGTGRFAADVLLALQQLHNLPTHYYIYEISPHLREKQRTHLQQTCPDLLVRVIWVDTLPHDFIGVMIANEVLDALPAHCFQVNEEGISERCVGWENDGFVWRTAPPTHIQLTEIATQLRNTFMLPHGYQSEINLHQSGFIQSLANALKQGIILLADYGYGQREYYHPERRRGTLTCFYKHTRHENPLIWPGLQDITTHVDFTRVIECAHENGCDLIGYTTQAAFLLACGLMELATVAEKNLPEADAFNLHHAVKLLTFPTEMGERIKIMGLSKGCDFPLMGFALQDRRRDL